MVTPRCLVGAIDMIKVEVKSLQENPEKDRKWALHHLEKAASCLAQLQHDIDERTPEFQEILVNALKETDFRLIEGTKK